MKERFLFLDITPGEKVYKSEDDNWIDYAAVFCMGAITALVPVLWMIKALP